MDSGSPLIPGQGRLFWGSSQRTASCLGAVSFSLPACTCQCRACVGGRDARERRPSLGFRDSIELGLAVQACILGPPKYRAKLAFSGCPGGPRQHAALCLGALNFVLAVHGARAHILGPLNTGPMPLFLDAPVAPPAHCSLPQFWSGRAWSPHSWPPEYWFGSVQGMGPHSQSPKYWAKTAFLGHPREQASTLFHALGH